MPLDTSETATSHAAPAPEAECDVLVIGGGPAGSTTAALLAERGRAPLLLLDDVLSELDTGRRRSLAARLAGVGQTIVTTTSADAFPAEPAQLVEVEPGRARAA